MDATRRPAVWAFMPATLATTLGACSGGGGGSGAPILPKPTPAPTASPTPAPTATPVPTPTPSPTVGTAVVTVTSPLYVPHMVTGRRKRQYVSPGTTWLGASVDGTPVAASAITQTCVQNPAADTVTCSYSFAAAPGSHVFALTLESGQGGAALSTATITATIVVGQTTALNPTFEGIPQLVSLMIDQSFPPVGTAATLHLTAQAADAAGFLIDSDPYATPIVVTSSDTSGQVTLSKTTLTSPNDVIDVSYTGKLVPNPVVFNISSPTPPSSLFDAVPFLPNPWQTFGMTSGQVISLATGVDGNIWFSGFGNSATIGKLSPISGQIVEYPAPASGSLVAGPDGNMWLLESNNPAIAKITPAGQITTYPLSQPGSGGITVGPDGNIWFTESTAIGKVTPAGVVSEYSLGGAYSPFSIVTGSDGALWSIDGPTVRRTTTSGVTTSYPNIGSHSSGPLTLGPDGRIYFGDRGNSLTAVNTSGVAAYVALTPQSTIAPWNGTGPDGNLWGFGAGYTNDQLPYSIQSLYNVVSASFNGHSTTYDTQPPPFVGSEFGTSSNGVWGSDKNLWIGAGNGFVRFRYDP